MDPMKRPNIIVFMTDQQNEEMTRKYAKTPNYDRFLESAVEFSDAYCVAPHCCPSRASFFTGLMPSQHGVWNNVEVDNGLSRGLFDGVRVFPEELKEAGYETIFSGKWHVSSVEWPQDRGFEKVLHTHITNYGKMDRENVPRFNDWTKLYCNPQLIDGASETKTEGRIIKEGYPHYYQYGTLENPFGDTDTVSKACKEIESNSFEKPVFMYIGTTGPHDPYFVPQRFLDQYKLEDIKLPNSFGDKMTDRPGLYRRTQDQFALSEEEQKESLRHYLAFLSYEDELFGKVLSSVEKRGIQDNTIILYLTDHGDYAGAHGLWAKGLPCFKEAYHICAAIGGAGLKKEKRKEDHLVSIMDFAPTILELAGVLKGGFTGQSLVPFINGKQPDKWRTEICTQTNGNELYGVQRAIWNKKWKYVYNGFDYDELYDLENDPDEMKNVINEEKNKDIIRTMCKKMWEFAKETKDNCTCGYIMVRTAPYGPGICNE